MTSPEIPESVRKFIDTHIDSVPHLEVLLLLRDAQRPVSIGDLAARAYLTPAAAQRVVGDLARHGLVSVDDSVARLSAEGALLEAVHEVALAYRSQLARIATYIHQNASSAVRAFARAFEFKKEP